VSDPVLIRADGSYLYTLPSVVDDADFGVTAVVRGEDHVTNTGVQIALFEALDAPPPAFGHHNLLVRADGEPLSKRDNPLSVPRLRADGYEPMAVASLAALVGTAAPVRAVGDLESLRRMVPLSAVSRAPATFDPADLDRLNAALLHEMPYEAVRDWLDAECGLSDPAFWETVRGNLAFRREAKEWAAILTAPPQAADGAMPGPEDRAVLAAALEALPPEPWDADTFRAWTAQVRSATGAKGKALFMPLRKALTGRQSGPEMAPLMRLLGRDAVAHRLARALDAAAG
jgi:glutamyl-tRNA synthetase